MGIYNIWYFKLIMSSHLAVTILFVCITTLTLLALYFLDKNPEFKKKIIPSLVSILTKKNYEVSKVQEMRKKDAVIMLTIFLIVAILFIFYPKLYSQILEYLAS